MIDISLINNQVSSLSAYDTYQWDDDEAKFPTSIALNHLICSNYPPLTLATDLHIVNRVDPVNVGNPLSQFYGNCMIFMWTRNWIEEMRFSVGSKSDAVLAISVIAMSVTGFCWKFQPPFLLHTLIIMIYQIVCSKLKWILLFVWNIELDYRIGSVVLLIGFGAKCIKTLAACHAEQIESL